MRILNNMAFLAITLPVCAVLAMGLLVTLYAADALEWIATQVIGALPDWQD